MKRRTLLGSIILFTGASLAGYIDAIADPSQQVEEVVVTAQKRSENLQEVPLSITAVTGESLQRQGITDLTAVLEQTPGVSFRTFGPGQTEILMRGLPPTGGNSPTVGFYLDEAPLTPPTGSQAGKVIIDPSLYDLQRVEVLRGPQGTLYGAGSMGGTVRLITNPPDPTKFSGSVRASTSDTENGGWNYAGDAALNIPIVQDMLAVRLVGGYSFEDGWINRIVVSPFPLETNPTCPGFYGCTRGNVLAGPVTAFHHDVNDLSKTSGRAEILYLPFDALSIEATGLIQRQSAGGFFTFDSDPGITNAHYQPVDFSEPQSDEIDLFNLLIKYRFGNFELTSATSRWYRTLSMTQDSSEVVQSILLVPQFGEAGILEQDKTDQTSEELRLATAGTGKLQGLIGGFVSSFDSNSYDNWYGPGYADLLGSSLLVWFYQPTHIDQYAVFGEGSYEITPALKFTAGLRWYRYTNSIMTTQYGALDGGFTPKVDNTSASASGFNPRFNLSYQATDDTLLYANVAKGFRPGAGNFFIPTTGPDNCAAALAAIGLTSAPAQYDPDSLWSYELGGKFQGFDRALTINGAVYIQKWNNIQQQVPLSCGYNFTANTGNGRIYGGELEITAHITPQLALSVNGGYSRAYLTEDTPETGAIAGQQLQNVPKLTLSGVLEYTGHLTSNLSYDAQLSGQYVGTRADFLGPLPAYRMAAIRMGLVSNRLAAYLFVDNLTNTVPYFSNDNSLSANLPSYNRISTAMPRTYGMDLTYKF